MSSKTNHTLTRTNACQEQMHAHQIQMMVDEHPNFPACLHILTMFPSTYSYRPYLHSSYHSPPAFYSNSGYPLLQPPTYLALEAPVCKQQHAEALAARCTWWVQYLPYEDAINSNEEHFYGLLNQREKIYLD